MGILRTDVISHSQLSNGNASVLFDGTTDSITIPSHSAFAFGTADWTVEGWFYFTSLSGQQTLVGDTYGGTAGWYLYKQDNHRLGVYYSSLLVDGNTLIETDRWYHLAFVRHSGRTRIYINGELDAEGADTTNATVTQYYIADTADQTSGEFFGNISNLRITRTAVYKTNFTVPKFKLKEIPGTILLCCQSSSSTTEATVSVPGTLTANGDPTATAFGPGLKEDITDTGVVFDGETTFDSQAFMVPPSGKTTERNRGRGLVGGGWSPSLLAQIYSVEIQSDGTSADFGDLTDARRGTGAAASATRAVWAGGYSPGYVDVMDFVTIASTANALDFGNLDFGRFETSGLGNDTRGVFGPSENPAQDQSVIQFITFATTGNATDFGDSTVATKKQASMCSNTRGLFAGGQNVPSPTNFFDIIDQITIASTGNATDFGDLLAANFMCTGVSDSTRGVVGGGNGPNTSGANFNVIQFVTIASAGNATDFGDLTSANQRSGGLSNSIRGLFSGGATPDASTAVNSIDKITIQTTGNAVDFGDYIGTAVTQAAGCSDSHGGLS